jgi:hypothetical protein
MGFSTLYYGAGTSGLQVFSEFGPNLGGTMKSQIALAAFGMTAPFGTVSTLREAGITLMSEPIRGLQNLSPIKSSAPSHCTTSGTVQIMGSRVLDTLWRVGNFHLVSLKRQFHQKR